MLDIAVAARTRLVVGARVERFDQVVTTQDPFGLFAREVQATNKNTDVFPAVNFVQGVGANEAPDIIEQGRGSLDLVFGQRIKGLGIRLTLENLTNSDYLFTQTLTTQETQRLFKLGRTVVLSLGYNVF